MSENEIPSSYEEWRNYITVRCNINLTPSYLSERLSELQDENHTRTKAFAKRYGSDQLNHTIEWFRKAAEETGRMQN